MRSKDALEQQVIEANISDLTNAITSLIEIEDYVFDSDELFEDLSREVNDSITPRMMDECCQDIVKVFQKDHYSDQELDKGKEELWNFIDSLIKENKVSGRKKDFILDLWQKVLDIYDTARNRYKRTQKVELPIKLDENAKLPTYAHENDACADLYAREDQVLKAHSLSNKIDTGVHIALPKGWKACIAARSSIGAKTGLRLSNAVAQIDEGYRGPLIVLYDNHSDSDYEIKAGDRIAQMWIEPVYQFAAKQVDNLDDTERSSGGLGSTGR
ncbi:MAG: dUTP diphosphatase [Bacilli bacterium]|nr:dUTP diphosphatase [Bacilli bacterium]